MHDVAAENGGPLVGSNRSAMVAVILLFFSLAVHDDDADAWRMDEGPHVGSVRSALLVDKPPCPQGRMSGPIGRHGSRMYPCLHREVEMKIFLLVR